MATIHPFRALRPRPEYVEEISCVPYDVISGEEARLLAYGKPRSFLHVIRPEIDLAEDVDEHADAVYEKGAENLARFASGEAFLTEESPSVYIYRLTREGRSQTGLFACVSVADYDADVILKHEKTRPDKEDDRTRHILTQQAHAEPIMLTFRPPVGLTELVSRETARRPLYDFVATDNVQHTIWRAQRSGSFIELIADVRHLYVADGHHRCKAASRAAAQLRSKHGVDPNAEYEFFPAVLFPIDQMQIMAYNRIIYTVAGGAAGLVEGLQTRYDLRSDAPPQPVRRGDVSIYAGGTWWGLTLPDSQGGSIVDSLDVARLGTFVLEPFLGISDPRTDPNIGFVGGIRGTGELEHLVDSGSAQLAISMYPTATEQLIGVSDAGLLMPPKSTWFEPKLRSGLLIHRF